MTCTAIAPTVGTFQQEWNGIFPGFTTLTGSRMFIKKLMAVTLSTMTYIRGVFPERAFGTRKLSGIKLKILSEETDVASVKKFINLVRSCYEAVDKKYLEQLSIGICTDIEKRDEVVEYYNLCFKYREDECSITCNDEKKTTINEKDPTVSATLWLLQSIMKMTDILEPLPPKAYLTMKLRYNENTPPDYEPEGFEPSDCEKYQLASDAVKLELGKVATSMHGYKMYLKTTLSKEPLMQYLEESIRESQDSKKSVLEDKEDMDVIEISDTEKIIEDGPIICLCGCQNDEGVELLNCLMCMKAQHSVCYGILKPQPGTACFYCLDCISEAPMNEWEWDVIYGLEKTEQKEYCAMRRAVVYCTTLKSLTFNQLEKHLGCSKQLAKLLIDSMESEKFIKRVGKGRYAVNLEIIQSKGYEKYFPAYENKENSGEKKCSNDKKIKQEKIQEKRSERILKRKNYREDEDDEDFQSSTKKKKGPSRLKEAIEIRNR